MVFVIDDDPAVRQSLCLLIATLGLEVRGHGDGHAFLDDARLAEASCVVLDQRMPGLDGLTVCARLKALNPAAQVIFISGHGDVPLAVAAMREGAVDFLQKPFDNRMLLQQVGACVARGRAQRQATREHVRVQDLLARLSIREREVLDLVVEGRMNKVIAAELGISEKTVEDHRARLMKKLEVRSLAALVRLAIRDQGSGIRDQGSGIRDQGSGIRDQGSGIRDQGFADRHAGAELTMKEAAGYLGVSLPAFRRMVDSGRLAPASRSGGKFRAVELKALKKSLQPAKRR